MKNTGVARNLSVAIPIDPTESTVEFYETHAREYFDRTVSADLSSFYDAFSKRVRLGGRVLDAGCGSGRDLKNLRARGFEAVGIDASGALVELAIRYSGADCFKMRLEDVNFKANFDAVWACASLLHVPKKRIVSVLQRLRKSLVEDGVLFASVQLGKGETLSPDGRFFAYYSAEELARVLKMAGFSVDNSWISEDTLPSRQSLRWLNIFARESRPF
jgi:2-polyprenyl-3-methyl-5-hydroxy-6-metoxy-1,4-benzoquinol methylase